MTCDKCCKQLDAYIDGELQSPEMIALKVHLEGCFCCRQELQTLKILKTEVSELPHVLPDEEFVDQLMLFVRAESAQRSTVRRRRLRVAAGLGAAMAIVSVYGYRLQSSQQALANQRAERQFELAWDRAYSSSEQSFGASPFVMPASYAK